LFFDGWRCIQSAGTWSRQQPRSMMQEVDPRDIICMIVVMRRESAGRPLGEVLKRIVEGGLSRPQQYALNLLACCCQQWSCLEVTIMASCAQAATYGSDRLHRSNRYARLLRRTAMSCRSAWTGFGVTNAMPEGWARSQRLVIVHQEPYRLLTWLQGQGSCRLHVQGLCNIHKSTKPAHDIDHPAHPGARSC
jgi:hypothetical protein